MARKKSKNTKAKQKPKTVTKIVYRDAPKPKNTVLGDLGALAGNSISKFFGLGSYKIKRNTVMDAWNKQVPFMHSSNESIVFRHREFITDISSSTTFASRTFNVNPGIEETFPYLAGVACNFEEYRFKGLVFEYKSTSADALSGTNTALGTVVLAAQYRSDAAAFTNKLQMENAVWAATTKPSESCFLPLECDPDQNPLPMQYIRTGSLPANQDVKLFDLAKLTVGTVGSQAVATVGELWVTYEVELRKPVLFSQGGAVNETYHAVATAGIASALVFGTARTVFTDTIGITLTSQRVTFPVGLYGRYNFMIIVRGSAAAAISTWTPTFTNCALVPNAWTNGTLAYNDNSSNTASNQYYVGIVEILDPTLAANVFFGSVSLPGTPTTTEIVITQVTPDYV